MQPKIGKSELDQLREEVDNQICHIQVASHDEEVFEYALQQVLLDRLQEDPILANELGHQLKRSGLLP